MSKTPKTANTFKKLCELERDNIGFGKNWILVMENKVSLGIKDSKGVNSVIVSKRAFERFIKFYETGK